MRPKPLAVLALTVLGGVLAVALWDGGSSTFKPAPVELETALESADVARRAAHEPGAARQPVSTVGGPRGRVLEVGSRRPLAGLEVQMRVGRRILALTTTGADGTFALPPAERERTRVEVLSADWRTTPRSIRLDGELLDGRAQVEFTAEPVQRATLQRRLVDERTGEPVGEFLVRIEGPPARRVPGARDMASASPPLYAEDMLADARGRVASAQGFEAGTLTARLLDIEPLSTGLAREVEFEHALEDAAASAPADLPIPVGPTYRLDLSLPDGLQLGDLHATFPRDAGPQRELYRLIAEDPNSPLALVYGSALKSERFEDRAPLRPGSPPWTRFRAPLDLAESRLATGTPASLQLRSEDGLWAGAAQVESLVGIQAEPVAIELAPRAVLSGVVQDGVQSPVRSVWVELFDAADLQHPVQALGADAQGHFQFRWLSGGAHVVVVTSERYLESRKRVELSPGERSELVVELSPVGPLGNVEGVLRGLAGQHRSRGGAVTLVGLDYPGVRLSKSISYRRRDQEYVAPFAFEGVPEGRYELTIHPLDNQRWNERSVIVRAPAEAIEFTCDDGVPTFDLEFRVLDAYSGAIVEPSWELAWQADPARDVELVDDWESGRYLGLPETLEFTWLVHAEGYRLARGNQTQVVREGDLGVIEARLERGWGQRFLVTTGELAPLAGVELLADGVSVAHSDALGVIELDLPARPRALEFRLPGWQVTWGSVDPGEENFAWGPQTPVYMGRDQEQ